MFGATATPRRAARVLLVATAAAIACTEEVPTATEPSPHDHPTIEADLSQSEVARALNDLRRHTAAWHNDAKAEEAGYTINIGCIDERVDGLPESEARGMGYHILNPDLLFGPGEAGVSRLLEPELIVYGRNPNSGKLRLAGFDYFIPGTEIGEFDPPPTLPELGLPFTWSEAFGGWMFHIWPWWHNPDGMFDNWNPAVPLCD